jgi:hypothetical protein
MKKLHIVAFIAALAGTSCGPLPNQDTIPPTVRLTYTSGVMPPSGAAPDGSFIHVAANQPISIFADGFSSLAGMKSIELDPDTTFNCINGQIGQTGSPTYAPVTKTAPQNPITLRLSVEMDLGTPASNCPPGWTVQWSGSFKATAVSYNGLKTTSSPVLNLISP